MIDARLAAVLVLTVFQAVTLHGCGGDSPSPASNTCSQEVDVIGMAYNVSCDENRTQTNIEAPAKSAFKYFIGKGGLVHFMYQIDDRNTFATKSAADIQKTAKGYVVTVHPLVSKLTTSICLKLVTGARGNPTLVAVQNDFACPSCSSATGSYYAYLLVAQSMSSGVPCPDDVALEAHNASDVVV